MQSNTNTSSGASQAASNSDCQPCDIPAFCRSSFYTGKLLTEGDLNRDQRYGIDKLRLHHTALHGWGVVCGLMVRPHPQCLDRFVITPGLAVDDCGREIRILKEYTKCFPKEEEPEESEPEDEDEDEHEGGCDDDERERRRHKRRERTYFVCIRYKECEEDFMPVVFDECCGTAKKPNRVCEGFEIDLVEEAPECLEEIERRRHCSEEEWHALRGAPVECCPPTGRICCIPLAVIRSYCRAEPLRQEMIDNRIRPVLHSTHGLERMIHCLEERLPRTHHRLTHITRLNWTHDDEIGWHEFWRDFVGGPDETRGFEIEFDRRVHPKGLNNRTFQATIVHEAAEPHAGRRVEIAPARVHRSEDGLRCLLQVDYEYVRRHLREHDFDVFITLRCDKVIDEEGLLVDGELGAALLRDEDRDYVVRVPTGNGAPGGLFESWIRVRREHEHRP